MAVFVSSWAAERQGQRQGHRRRGRHRWTQTQTQTQIRTQTHTEADGVCSWQLVKEYWGEDGHANAHTYNDLVETVSRGACGGGACAVGEGAKKERGLGMGREATLAGIDKMRSNAMLTESGVITQ